MNPGEEWADRPDVDPDEQLVHHCPKCDIGMIGVGGEVNDLYVCLECGHEMEKTTLTEWNRQDEVIEPFDIVMTAKGEGLVTDKEDDKVMVTFEDEGTSHEMDVSEVWHP